MKRILLLTGMALAFLHGSSQQLLEIAVQKGHSADITTLAFSPDSRLLASSGKDHLIKLWHVPTGKEMASFVSGADNEITGLAFSAENDFLYVLYDDQKIHTWDIATSRLKTTERPDPLPLFRNKLEYRDPGQAFSIQIDRFFVRKKLSSGKQAFAKVPVDISQNFNAVSVIRKYSRIAGANQDGDVYTYDLLTGKTQKVLEEHYGPVNDVACSPDERIFATASSDRSIIIWDSQTLKPIKRLFSRSFRFECMAFDPTGTKLVVGDELGEAHIIDLQSSRVKVNAYEFHQQKMTAVTYSTNGDWIYSGGHDNRIVSFDVKQDRIIQRETYLKYISLTDGVLKLLKAHREPYAWVNTISASGSNQYLLAGGGWRESVIRKQPQPIWFKDERTQHFRAVKAHQGNIQSIAYVTDLNFLTGNANQLIDWYYDAGTAELYMREYLLQQGSIIRKIHPYASDSVLINAGTSLIWYSRKNKTAGRVLESGKAIDATAFDPGTGRLAYATFGDLKLQSQSGAAFRTITQAHTDKITAMAFSPTRPILATASWDATVKIWNSNTGELIVTIVPIGKNDHIVITPDGYYYGTRQSLKGVGFKLGKHFVSPEQFDLRYNRPDIVLQRLGFVSANVVKSYRRAYEKRLQKLNFDEEALSAEYNLPDLHVTGTPPLTTASAQLNFSIKADDEKYPLERINVSVNEVPVFGMSGIDISTPATKTLEKEIQVRLSAGRNKIQVTCLNSKGVESLAESFEVTYEAPQRKPALYLNIISVSEYANQKMNLRYAAKDGRDLARLFDRHADQYSEIHIDTLFNKAATRENILKLKKGLARSHEDDEVILFASGHGMLDDKLDFYFGTHDIAFDNPSGRGIRYEELEGLLDSIPARNKLLLVDACHSGEVDKRSLTVSDQPLAMSEGKRGTLKTYTYAPEATEETYRLGITTSFDLMQEIFNNVSKGSGAVVISAAAGNSYALESDEWKNGVFTYALLYGLREKKADQNKDGIITVTELKTYISAEVERLTNGEQKPTSRRENLEFDFVVWRH